MRYIVITPVRDEERHLPKTIESIARQTVPPQQWIIVNDGSSDATGRIADDAAKTHSWIRVIHRANRGARKSGGGVIEAFNDGYRLVTGETWDFIVKLDGDLSFEPGYFEKCFAHFAVDPKLGMGGGTILNVMDGVLTVDSPEDPKFHVRGATKIYRAECWRKIGGLIQAPGWDTLDEVKANMWGWRTRTFEDLTLHHHRPTGEADGTWKNWVKNGRANYIVGYHPLFMFLKCARRLFRKPYGVAAVGLMTGYMKGCFSRQPRIVEADVIRYLRTQQMNRLLLRESIWADGR